MNTNATSIIMMLPLVQFLNPVKLQKERSPSLIASPADTSVVVADSFTASAASLKTCSAMAGLEVITP